MHIRDSQKQTNSSNETNSVVPAVTLLKRLLFKQTNQPLKRRPSLKKKLVRIESYPLAIDIQSKFPLIFKSLPKLKGRVTA